MQPYDATGGENTIPGPLISPFNTDNTVHEVIHLCTGVTRFFLNADVTEDASQMDMTSRAPQELNRRALDTLPFSVRLGGSLIINDQHSIPQWRNA